MANSPDGDSIAPDEIHTCRRVLETLRSDPEQCLHNTDAKHVLKLASDLTKAVKRITKNSGQARDHDLRAGSAIHAPGALPIADNNTNGHILSLSRHRPCYVCRQPFTELHWFYDSLCPVCARENYERRFAQVDLSGRVAVVTGGRIRIGYQTVLKLLRCGACVLATTRFPALAAERYCKEPDFAVWRDRLSVYELDLRSSAEIESFVQEITARDASVDILINNAAQTVRRTAAYYQQLTVEERARLANPSEQARKLLRGHVDTHPLEREVGVGLPQLLEHPRSEQSASLTAGQFDREGEPLDERTETTWTARISDVTGLELAEVHMINALAPYMLISRLEPLMLASSHRDRYIVNVSSAEGRFAAAKNGAHPHTNMAKASLNMLTRTIAESFAKSGIYVTSVDPGSVSLQHPILQAEQLRREGKSAPLDATDGACRVVDPIFRGVNGQPTFGKLWKDYHEVEW